MNSVSLYELLCTFKVELRFLFICLCQILTLLVFNVLLIEWSVGVLTRVDQKNETCFSNSH